MKTQILTIPCPECQQLIALDSDWVVGQQATCQSCYTDFVVIWLFPVILDYLETSEFVDTEGQQLDNFHKSYVWIYPS
jgi:hypothetical protein